MACNLCSLFVLLLRFHCCCYCLSRIKLGFVYAECICYCSVLANETLYAPLPLVIVWCWWLHFRNRNKCSNDGRAEIAVCLAQKTISGADYYWDRDYTCIVRPLFNIFDMTEKQYAAFTKWTTEYLSLWQGVWDVCTTQSMVSNFSWDFGAYCQPNHHACCQATSLRSFALAHSFCIVVFDVRIKSCWNYRFDLPTKRLCVSISLI